MHSSTRGTMLLSAVALALLTVTGAGRGGDAPNPAPAAIKFGMIQTLFRGTESGAMLAQSGPFGHMLHAQTGLRGEVAVVADELEMARKIQDGELQLGILHGVEYAWIQERYPDLKPLVLAFNQVIKLKGYLLVRNDSGIRSLGELQGKTLALPGRSMNHCHLFLHKSLQEAGLNPAGFFAASPLAKNAETALDSVVDGTNAVTVIDGVAWEAYRERKPGRAGRLVVLKESNCFPTATVIYKPKDCDLAAVRQFRDGMTRAHQKPIGRQLLNLWRISQFSDVPEEYGALLADVRKDYPRPLQPARFIREEATLVVSPMPAAVVNTDANGGRK